MRGAAVVSSEYRSPMELMQPYLRYCWPNVFLSIYEPFHDNRSFAPALTMSFLNANNRGCILVSDFIRSLVSSRMDLTSEIGHQNPLYLKCTYASFTFIFSGLLLV